MFLRVHCPHTVSLLAAGCVVFFFATIAAAQTTERQRVNIHSGWTFRLAPDSADHYVAKPAVDEKTRAAASAWLPAEVPGVVQTDLLKNGIIPDPFYRDNETRLQWIGLEDWEYRTTFQVDPSVLARKHVELVFDGLDTYADVFLNDKPVLQADNMFRTWRVNAASGLKAGANTLRVVFRSPVQKVLKQVQNEKYKLPTVGQVLIVSELGIPTDPYTRKAPYHYGWDWGPRFVTEGIWRPVRLESWDAAAIRDLHVQQNEVTPAIANLTAQLDVESDSDAPATVTIDFGSGDQKSTIERQVTLHAGSNHVDVPIQLANPARWFPAGYGAQSLYRFAAVLRVNGAVADRASVRTGLRSLELRRQPDQWGKSFEFVVNGIPVFGKGANVIPFDSFPNRVTPERYRSILADARAANMNMVRAWGGGYYENDEFYDACDELGIMVWQDFMFGGAVQPGDPAFLENVRHEAIDNVTRLRDHPSIVLWCGNNEQEAAWFWWGDRRGWKAGLPPDAREHVWQDYLLLFKGVLQTVVTEYARPVPYMPSSPSSDFETLPGAAGNGDMHYWDVWHARAPLEDYEKQFPRFMSEFGFQSFPEMKTIQAFSIPEDWAIESPVMLAHQKNVGGNARIHDYMLKYYGEPRDFASFLYVSQVLQAEGIRIGAEHLRRQRPRTMGSLYWQLNDCWPVASWASIDYYGRWKALHYFARRFYNDLLISPDEKDGAVSVYVVSDRVTPTTARVRVRLMDFTGRVVSDKTEDTVIPPLSSAVYVKLPIREALQGQQPGAVFLATDLLVDGAAVSRNVHFFARMKDVVLPAVQIKTTLEGRAPEYRLRLQSGTIARNVYVAFGALDATVSDNYFDLIPGEQTEIRIRSTAPLQQLRGAMQVTSLVDAFAKTK